MFGLVKNQTPGFMLRLIWSVALVVIAAASFSNVRGSVELMANPELAYGRLGWSSFAAGRIADQVLIEQPNAAGLGEAARLARKSLEAQVLNAQALRVLGVAADREGQSARALTLMKLSDQLSRRDLGTQVWLVNHNVALNDATESLRHYDTLLRASTEIQPVLFPILQRALGEPSIRAAFAPYIRSGAPWLPNFIAFQISSSADPSNVANAIIAAGGLPSQPDFYRGLEGQLLTQLADTRHFDTLRTFYSRLRGAQPDVLSSAAFTSSTTDQRFAPMTWKISEAATITSAFETDQSQKGLALHVIAGTGQRGPASSKLILLPPGHYRLTSALNFIHHGVGSGLLWNVRCASTNSDLPLKDVGRALYVAAVEFDVTNVCGAEQLALIASGGDPADGSETYVRDVSLVRLGDPLPQSPAGPSPVGPTPTVEPKLF